MKHSHALPLAEHPAMTFWSQRPPWAERAIGAAAAAVFLAGIVSAGLVDSEGGPGGPALAAPAAAAPSGGNSARSVDHVVLPTYSPDGVSRPSTASTRKAGASTRGDLARVAGSVPPSPPSTAPNPNPAPSGPPSTVAPPAAQSPQTAPELPALPLVPTGPTLPVPLPDQGATVGPVTVDTSSTDGATVTVAPGIVDPIAVSFP